MELDAFILGRTRDEEEEVVATSMASNSDCKKKKKFHRSIDGMNDDDRE